jgi:hypothetical protein
MDGHHYCGLLVFLMNTNNHKSKRGDLRNSAFALKTKTNRKEGAVNMFRKTKRPPRRAVAL